MSAQAISIFIFIAIILLVLGIQELKAANRQLLTMRIKKLAAKDTQKQSAKSHQTEQQTLWRKLLTTTSKLFIAKRLGRLVDKQLEEAGILLRGEEFIIIVLAVILSTALLISTITLNLVTGLLTGLIAGIIPFIFLNKAKTKRLASFNSQISDALTIMANSMRSGFSFLQSMDMVRKELPNPISEEFDRALQEINLGSSTEEALQKMAKRVNSVDLDLVVTAVLIQREVGGNLAELFDNISDTIRERIRFQGEVKTITAQGRISGIIIGLLPVILTVIMFVINPSYIMVLFTNQLGLLMLGTAAIGMIIGALLIKKIINIKV